MGSIGLQLFKIDSATGVLSFIAEPNFENDQSVGQNNEINFHSRQGSGPGEAFHEVTVGVDDLPELPSSKISRKTLYFRGSNPISWSDGQTWRQLMKRWPDRLLVSVQCLRNYRGSSG